MITGMCSFPYSPHQQLSFGSEASIFSESAGRCQLQFFSSISPRWHQGCVQSLVFQLWVSSHAPAMALRVHLVPRSVSSEVCECANQVPPGVPHVILWLRIQWPVLDRLEALLASSLSHWGPTLSSSGSGLFAGLSRHFARLQ